MLENRRIIDLLRSIEAHAIALRDNPPADPLVEIDELWCSIELPMDRPLFKPPVRLLLKSQVLESGVAQADPDALYAQQAVDRTGLAKYIEETLAEHKSVTLR